MKEIFLIGSIENFSVACLISDAQQVLCEKISKFFTHLVFDDIIFLTIDEIAKYIEKYEIILYEIKSTLSKFKGDS